MIGTACQNGDYVEVYNENGSYKFNKRGELYGFTSTTVSVKNGDYVEIYDENGSYKFNKRVG